MCRNGNSEKNSPIESFFGIYKTELLQGLPPCNNITELRKLSLTYIDQFNNERISLKTKGMTPVGYRNHALAV
ncbi:integrase [Ligilactobacillus agilis]|uniref:IS3 family transposase n=1 Tax=Ligilactobacillus agilis TaxID=1601 RepID=UPI000B5D97C7|nr:IS3 family transposase [Ligilactobacillus agilis]OXC06531.1 integrase [Ligilactobacillus agilis]